MCSITTKSGNDETSGYSMVISLGELGSSVAGAPFPLSLAPLAAAAFGSAFLPGAAATGC